MYCPECGNDAGSAKFCPECGANLTGVKEALSGRRPAEPAAPVEPAEPSTSPAETAEAGKMGGPSRLSPAVVWGGFGAVAVIVIIVVVMLSGGFGKGSDSGAAGAASGIPSARAIAADTSGAYDQLVERANDLFKEGGQLFQTDMDQAVAYFDAASKVYAAAWAKQATDPRVGTDYGIALFYGGDIPAALKQINAVLKASPDYQKAWLNKGIFVSHQGQLAKREGNAKKASAYFDEARTALAKAVALDPKSAIGKQADSFMSAVGK